MRVLVGTSGYSYKEWKGKFYPDDLPASGMLRYYAERLGTVEINNTFYRMPTEKLVAGWAAEVPASFRFAVKAPQRITHILRLKDAADPTAAFVRIAGTLGDKLGPLIFQLPPNFKKDIPRLSGFLEILPESARVTFEFRHASWFGDDVYEVLRARRVALCIAEADEPVTPGPVPLVATADWGYLRLRRTDYTDDVLATWAERIRAQAWTEAFVYLKHDEGDAPALASRLIERLGS